MKETLARFFVPLFAAVCLTGWLSPGAALFVGILTALTLGNPYAKWTRPRVSQLLGIVIVGLGAGMDLGVVARVGVHGFGYTLLGISATVALGALLAKLLKVETGTALLITSGTAICGGSAIAAVAATVKSKQEDISVALATVFCLNAAALYLFPAIGHALAMPARDFGLWSALAIHDTSSVVGAAVRYAPESVPVAATVKLARALWIAPLAFAFSVFQREPGQRVDLRRLQPPWFIPGFLVAAAVCTWIPGMAPVGAVLSTIAKHLLVLTLFLIGSHLSPSFLKNVGSRPIVMGLALWVCVSTATLAAICFGWIAL